ncbi:unnamed protein product [Paramecium pentaurelia]|uniref:Uncharacterized protein n=1 Tax=Paramecium pentaurelia TaxID=43138 RepID=A0A8S1WCN3_9CILI|nr:unnamed protein product [Paramecium pentaurelia]
MPPRKTQTIKDVMKESKPIIDQKLGTTRSKKVKKNENDEDSDYVNTTKKQKKSNQSSKIKSSTGEQRESLNSDDPQDKLSPELKPSSSVQKARTKAEKMQYKHNTKKDEVRAKQENENQNQNLDKDDENIDNLKIPQQVQENENLNKNELNNKDNNQEQQQHQEDNNEQQMSKNNEENIFQNQQKNEFDLQVIPQIIINGPESEIKKDKQRQEEEEKEQLEKQQKLMVDIVFCCDAKILDCSSIEQLQNTIECILQQIKEKKKFNSSIKFSLVHFYDLMINQKLQQCQVIDLCDEDQIIQSLDEIKQRGQMETQKGLFYGLKLATSTTKWRKDSNNKTIRYIIHIANKQLQLDNQSEELDRIIQEMNNKNIRYKYLRIDKKINLDYDGKQYFQNKLNSYEESFLKEFGSLKNVVSSIILRELLHENNK